LESIATVKKDAQRKQIAAKNHGVEFRKTKDGELFSDFRSKRDDTIISRRLFFLPTILNCVRFLSFFLSFFPIANGLLKSLSSLAFYVFEKKTKKNGADTTTQTQTTTTKKMLVNTTTTTATATTNTTKTTNTTTTTTKRRRRGQNASTNPGLEEIEVDLDVLRESLKCELCKNLLRDANTVVRLMSFFLKCWFRWMRILFLPPRFF